MNLFRFLHINYKYIYSDIALSVSWSAFSFYPIMWRYYFKIFLSKTYFDYHYDNLYFIYK